MEISKPILKYKTEKVVQVSDWDNFVKEVYDKPYAFQQQWGCQDRGIFHLQVDPESYGDQGAESIEEKVNGNKMCVSLKTWIETDPKTHQERNNWKDFEVRLFWYRNFFPDIEVLATDLCQKGLLEKGDYLINIDW